jgi:hypothetical protein
MYSLVRYYENQPGRGCFEHGSGIGPIYAVQPFIQRSWSRYHFREFMALFKPFFGAVQSPLDRSRYVLEGPFYLTLTTHRLTSAPWTLSLNTCQIRHIIWLGNCEAVVVVVKGRDLIFGKRGP